jgi:hypothetical protein
MGLAFEPLVWTISECGRVTVTVSDSTEAMAAEITQLNLFVKMRELVNLKI